MRQRFLVLVLTLALFIHWVPSAAAQSDDGPVQYHAEYFDGSADRISSP